MRVTIDGTPYTVREFCRTAAAEWARVRRVKRARAAILAQGADRMREELADHLSSWVTTAVRQATRSDTDLSVEADLSGIAQRLSVACALLDGPVADELNRAWEMCTTAHRKSLTGHGRTAGETLAWAVVNMRRARSLHEGGAA